MKVLTKHEARVKGLLVTTFSDDAYKYKYPESGREHLIVDGKRVLTAYSIIYFPEEDGDPESVAYIEKHRDGSKELIYRELNTHLPTL